MKSSPGSYILRVRSMGFFCFGKMETVKSTSQETQMLDLPVFLLVGGCCIVHTRTFSNSVGCRVLCFFISDWLKSRLLLQDLEHQKDQTGFPQSWQNFPIPDWKLGTGIITAIQKHSESLWFWGHFAPGKRRWNPFKVGVHLVFASFLSHERCMQTWKAMNIHTGVIHEKIVQKEEHVLFLTWGFQIGTWPGQTVLTDWRRLIN